MGQGLPFVIMLAQSSHFSDLSASVFGSRLQFLALSQSALPSSQSTRLVDK